MFADIRVPGGEPYEAIRDGSCAARSSGQRDGVRRLQHRPRTRVLLLPLRQARVRDSEVLDEGGYFDLTTLDAGTNVRRETVLALEQLGIHVDTHHEVGPSQHEVDIAEPRRTVHAADPLRITVKEYAMKYGWHATFMPKPLQGENGSGMHVHQSLSKDGKNAFFDADDQYFLSETAKAFIAGRQGTPGDLASVRSVGQLLQAAGARL